jgi:uncharacterized protein YndB with AHSA1/START domain
MLDLIRELDAIRRGVTRDDASVTVTVSRSYDADAGDVWDALTDPERLPRWFYPVTGDLREGGTFQLVGNAGGDILVCDAPRLLRLTFGGPESVVEVRLGSADGATTLELEHTVPVAMAGSGAGALFVGPGWDGALLGMGVYLRGETVGDPLEAANSPEVIEFNRGSIEHWEAAIAGTATEEEIAAGREVALAQYTVLPG